MILAKRVLASFIVISTGLASIQTLAASCEEQMSRLGELKEIAADGDSDAIAKMRDGLLTVAVLETPLLRSQPFADSYNKIMLKMKGDIPDENVGEAEIQSLQNRINVLSGKVNGSIAPKTGNFLKDAAIGAMEGIARAKLFSRESEELKSLKNEKLPQAEKHRIEMLEKRKQLLKAPDVALEKLPTITRVAIANEIWNDLSKFYFLPSNYEKLDFSAMKPITDRASQSGLALSDMIACNTVIEGIKKDPFLQKSMIEVIADTIIQYQKKPALLTKAEKFKKKVIKSTATQEEQYTVINTAIQTYHVEDKAVTFTRTDLAGTAQVESKTVPFKDFVSEEYPLLFTEGYFDLFVKILEKNNIVPEELTKNYEKLNPLARLELSQRIWNGIKEFYLIDGKPLSDALHIGKEISERASQVNLTPDEFLKNVFLVKVISYNAVTLKAALELIDQTIMPSIALLPHLKNANKWKKIANIGKNVTAYGPIASGLGAGAFALSHALLHTVIPGGSLFELWSVGATATGGLGQATKYGSQFIANRSANKKIQEFKKNLPSNNSNHSEE